jgi:mannose-6-phosphate isomerase-like protein (cupin superfamily)
MVFGVDAYLEWIAKEGLLVHEGLALNLLNLETRHWPRFGVPAAVTHFTGRGDFCSMFVFEVPAGAASNPVRHLYEALFFVLDGRGSTQIELVDGTKRSFEWGPRSFFAIPLNATYRHFNASGKERALLCCTTTAPLVMKTFHNADFVFNCPFDFTERVGPEEFYSGEGELHLRESGLNTWQTNFIPDLNALELTAYDERGPGSSNIKMQMADSIMHAHISEIAPATYKKGHRHGAGTHVLTLTGGGYSLLWYPGDPDFTRVDWEYGTVFPPLEQQFHQHFVTTPNPSRYLATTIGGMSYIFTNQQLRTGGYGRGKAATKTSIKEGGDQIEYEDQDPRIHQIWLEEMRRAGITPRFELPNAASAH